MMLYLILIFLPCTLSLDILSSGENVMENNHVHNSWDPDFSDYSTCKPVPSIYESSSATTRIFSFKSTEELSYQLFAKSSNEDIEVRIIPSSITSSNFQGKLEYFCLKDGWALIELKILYENNEKTIKLVKICGKASLFDWSLGVLTLIVTSLIVLSVYIAQLNIKSHDVHNNSLYPTLIYLSLLPLLVISLHFFIQDLKLILEIIIFLGSFMTTFLLFLDLTSFIPSSHSSTIPVLGTTKTFHIFLFLITLLTTILYILTRHWILTNLISISLVYIFIKNHRISSMRTGIFILLGLFVYSILTESSSKNYFTDNAMLIKNSDYDLPIKILIPFFASFPIPGQCSAIGISDLIVPGIFIAFGAVYDKKTGSKYFHVLTFLYFTSLFVAVSVDVVFSKIQPAMLYIAPILICGMGLCAVYRKEFWKIWLGELGKPLMQSEVAMKNLSNL